VKAHQLLLDNIVCFAISDFGGAHPAFLLMIKCAVRRYGFLLRTLPPDICMPYLANADRADRYAFSRIFGVSHEVQTLDQLNYAKRQLSLPAEFVGLYVPSLEVDTKHIDYASFIANPILITSPSREVLCTSWLYLRLTIRWRPLPN
jgi:hypothetical protein